MVKILATGDNHIDRRSARWDENLGVHEWFCDLVEKEKPDLACFTGDWYERPSVPEERRAASRVVRRVASVCPVVGVGGNHDAWLDTLLLGDLAGKHPICMVEDARVVHLVDGIRIAAMAWPRLGNTIDDGVAREQLRDVLRALDSTLNLGGGDKVVRIGLGHWDISGAAVGEAGQPLIGKALTLSPADLGLLRAQMVVAGHIHKPQTLHHGDMHIHYCGSKIRHDWGEREQKSVLLIEGDHTRLTSVRIPTPARDMIALEADWEPDAPGWAWCSTPLDGEDVRGHDVRFRYNVDMEHLATAVAEADRMQARILGAGAATCKLDKVPRVVTRARTPEITTKKTLADQMVTVWGSTGNVPPEPEAAELLAGLEELRAAVAEEEAA